MASKSSLWTDEQLISAIKSSDSKADVLRCMGLGEKVGQGYYVKRINEDIARLNIDTTHFKRKKSSEKYEEKNIFIPESKYSDRKSIKKRLLASGLLYKCSECGIAEWNGKSLSLHLDHINGINNDNRKENLRLLCPNCHSQTDTYCGKNNKSSKAKDYKCSVCGVSKKTSASMCSPCAQKNKSIPKKIIWPSVEEMKTIIWSMPTSKLAKQLGVSDKAIEKFCKKHKVSKPPRGHWNKP